MIGGLDAVDGTADEIDQRIRTIEDARPVIEGARIPWLERPRALLPRPVPREQGHAAVVLIDEMPSKTPTEKATSPGDHDP